ncbi:MAG TPA: pyridoxamine 5'-phosphate oxidase family protein [Candidatus Methylomirabilis sp.]|nr:pyridoxamine 5'-phosphate oxidase family protein [Candidatus Methylomirabilis sp.]
MRLKKTEREFVMYQRVCRVATVSRDGRPHNVPVCPILEGDRIYFASAADGVKVQNVRATGQVALTYDEYTEAWPGLKGILIWGTGRVIESGPTFRRIRRRLYERFPQYESQAPLEEKQSVILEVAPTRAFSWGL